MLDTFPHIETLCTLLSKKIWISRRAVEQPCCALLHILLFPFVGFGLPRSASGHRSIRGCATSAVQCCRARVALALSYRDTPVF